MRYFIIESLASPYAAIFFSHAISISGTSQYIIWSHNHSLLRPVDILKHTDEKWEDERNGMNIDVLFVERYSDFLWGKLKHSCCLKTFKGKCNKNTDCHFKHCPIK